MIVVTGGAGFIGSNIVADMNAKDNCSDIIIVDELSKSNSIQLKNLSTLKYRDFISAEKFLRVLRNKDSAFKDIDLIVHMGACSSTTEKNLDYLLNNNFQYTRELFDYSVVSNSRLIYASSAAVYGDGSLGFDDRITANYIPLNNYAFSKKLFDLYYCEKKIFKTIPKQCVGLRFFNVYGPREEHKGDMASAILHSYKQVKDQGKIKLFKSDNSNYQDGFQSRDFVHVDNCVDVVMFMLKNPEVNGIFNVGTGISRTYNDMSKAVFAALGQEPNIEYIDMPEKLKGKYQYKTQADISKLRKAGYNKEFYSLEDGIKKYVSVLESR